MSELQKNLGQADNNRLLKQINNCFQEGSYIAHSNLTNFNIGPVVMAPPKTKLNKSFENIFAANKGKSSINNAKKNLSTSPRRNSSSGKKVKSAQNNNKKKYLDQSIKNNTKALCNMRDLNFFIKTIEKDLCEKFNKLNLKDFNSMPTTPTSILKKVEDQMKALAKD